jgi:hypothetical protein
MAVAYVRDSRVVSRKSSMLRRGRPNPKQTQVDSGAVLFSLSIKFCDT